MYFGIGAAASSAVDLLSSLLPSKARAGKPASGAAFGSASATITPSNAIPTSGGSGRTGALSPQTMNALFAAQDPSQSSTPTSKADALKDLFSKLDGNGDGKITKAEFEDKLGAGGTNVANADKVFGKIDTNGDGSVSLDELTAALTVKKSKGARHANNGEGKGGEDALLKALDGSTGKSVTNSDGSTTTTMTYADGSSVTLTTPAASSNSNASRNASSSYNLVEQMIQKQANALATSAKQSLSVSV